MFLYTPDRTSFYARLGWPWVESRTYRGEDVSVIACDLTSRHDRHLAERWPANAKLDA
jgi:hypothetical protein